MVDEIVPLTRRNQTQILSALSEITQARVADRMGISETTLSRAKDGDIERLSSLLAACNLVATPRNHQMVDPDELFALRVLARKTLDRAPREPE